MKSILPAALCLVFASQGVRGQDPNLAPDDLKYSREAYAANHLIARVAVAGQADGVLRYRYDRYADLKRITTNDGVAYAQPKGKPWLKSNDWGKTGSKVKEAEAGELEWQANIAEAVFVEPEHHDLSQGGTVWKFIEKTAENDVQLFTYERSREKPNPDGVYPRLTFAKFKNNTDGKLLLSRCTGNLRGDHGLIPFDIKYDLMIMLPADTVIEVAPTPKKKK